MSSILERAKEHLKCYDGLEDQYPNAKKFAEALRGSIEPHIPSNEDFKDPKKLNEWSKEVVLNQVMGPMGKKKAVEEVK